MKKLSPGPIRHLWIQTYKKDGEITELTESRQRASELLMGQGDHLEMRVFHEYGEGAPVYVIADAGDTWQSIALGHRSSPGQIFTLNPGMKADANPIPGQVYRVR